MKTQMGFESEEDADYQQQMNAAIRRRLLAEIERGNQGGGQSIVNNVYGGGGAQGGEIGGGIREAMAEDIDPALRDYYVDIEREDLPGINPATGKPVGWRKKVKRYSTARFDAGDKKKVE